jgi:hypothetical protein
VPNPANPQSWNRYSYVNNSPVHYNDPTGHYATYDESSTCVGDKCASAGKINYLYHAKHRPKNGGIQEGPGEIPQISLPPEDSQGTPNSALDVLEMFNYRIGPQSSQRIYYSNWYIWDLEITWLPSITFDNGSSVTLGSDGFDFDLGDGPVTGSMSLSDDGVDFGYMSSPFVDDWNSATGMSISTPTLFQPYAVLYTTQTSIGRGGVTFDTDLTVTMRIRQDQTTIGGAVGGFVLLREKIVLFLKNIPQGGGLCPGEMCP